MAITVTDIVTEFGAYYLGNENNQNAARILRLPLETDETSELFPLQLTENQGLERRSNVTQDRVLQPFQKDFTNIGTTEFKPMAIPMFRQKIDLEEMPDDLVKSWLAFLTSSNIDRATWPFIKWWLETLIIPGYKRDMEMNEIFAGEWVEPTPGTAGAVSTAMDGIKTIINAAYAGGTLDGLIALGAVPSDEVDFCEYIEAMAAGIPEIYWSEKLTFGMSKVLRNRYRKGRRKKYNLMYAQVTDLDAIEDFETFGIKGLNSHKGSTKIWTSPEWNKVRLVNGIGNMGNFKVESVKRKVSVYTDWWTGIGYWIPQLIFTNDVELS